MGLPGTSRASSGPRRQLGRDGLAHLKELLGGPPGDWTVESAFFTARAVEFSVVSGPRRLEFSIVPDMRRGARCAVLPRGSQEGPSDEEKALGALLARGPSQVAFTDLLARLRRDGLLYSDPDGSRVPSRLDRYFRVNDHRPDFWKFVYPQWRCLEEKVVLGSRWARINYSTLECRLSNPNPEVPSLRLFADELPDCDADDCANVETVMTEADVVGGRTQALLGATLERVAREDRPAFIHLNTTCMPELLGDTPVPYLSRVEEELGVPVFWTSKTRPGGPLYAAWIDRLLTRAEFDAERDPRAVLLAGVPSAAAGDDAARLLGTLGLRVVGTVFPNMDFGRFPGMGAASAVVWLDPIGWETVGDGAFLRHGLAVVRTHPPYGLAGTRAWLGRIASVLGLEAGEAPFPRAAELDAIRTDARRRTVVLAGDTADVGLLTSEGRALGFSAAALLGELGFSVRCLIHDAGGKTKGLRRPKAALGAGTIEFEPFTTPAQLDRALSRADLVFSHLNHDERLEAHGVRGFTEAAFETGLDGLLRSGRRLLDKCAARPFAAHRALLPSWLP